METVQQLAQILDMQEEEVTRTAHQALLNLVLIAEEYDFSKKGLVEELEAGIKPGYINTVGLNEDEVKDLDIEVMARVGEKRIEMKNCGSQIPEGMKEYPLNVVEGQLGEKIQ
jgi:hypothetical protein